MSKIKYEEYKGKNVDFLKQLVNELMVFQAKRARIFPEIMASMNYDNRLKLEYKGTDNEYMLVAYSDDKAIGFAYGTIAQVSQKHLDINPDWAKGLVGEGFYPGAYDVPKKIGTFKLLYVNENYRGFNIGKKLSVDLMNWLKSKDIEDIWVYVANGNEKIGKFYKKLGFSFSHSVYEVFIDAYNQKTNKSLT